MALSGDPAYLFFPQPPAVKCMIMGNAPRRQGRIVSEKELDGIIAEHDRDGDGHIDAVRARARRASGRKRGMRSLPCSAVPSYR